MISPNSQKLFSILFTLISLALVNAKAEIIISPPNVLVGGSYENTSNTISSCNEENSVTIFKYTVYSTDGNSIAIDQNNSNLDSIFGENNWSSSILNDNGFRNDSLEIFIQINPIKKMAPFNGNYQNLKLALLSEGDESNNIEFNFVHKSVVFNNQNATFCSLQGQPIPIQASSNSNLFSINSGSWFQISGPPTLIIDPNNPETQILFLQSNAIDTLVYRFIGTTSPDLTSGTICQIDDTLTFYVSNTPPTRTDEIESCGPITWIDGITYSESNNTTQAILQNPVGCDSIIFLDLTILQPGLSIDSHTETDSLIWIDGNVYKSSNTSATHTIVGGSSNGCDSIITLNLNIPNKCELVSKRNSFEWIKQVVFGSEFVNNSSKDGNGFGDYSANPIFIEPGQSIQIDLTPGYRKRAYKEYWRVWADWNGDGDFDDENELIFQASGKNQVRGTFIIPQQIINGEVEVRVAMKWKGYPNQCGSYTGGEVEKYTFLLGL